uniref:Uncharacterized protein n=1 Tax=Schlesneria paludicola TaxID=360056 RepID=A0A7C2K2S0_9PLAN
MDQPPTHPLPRRVAWFAPWTWRRRSWFALLPVLLLVAYPLSIGPAVLLLAHDWLNFEVFRSAYYPLLWVSDHSDALGKVLDWYVAQCSTGRIILWRDGMYIIDTLDSLDP